MTKLVVNIGLWLRQLDRGKVATISELAEQENLDNSYVAKVMRLTLLAPDALVVVKSVICLANTNA